MRTVAEHLEKRLVTLVAQASVDFGLLESGDRVLVAVSGGKDSLSLLALLRLIQRRTPFPFSLAAITVDQGQPAFRRDRLVRYFESEHIDYQVVVENIYSAVKEKNLPGATACSLCSRLRRGVLYTAAVRLGATKIALGHHRDDAIETLLLNVFYSGQLKAMPAKLFADDGRNTVIRPLIYCAERDLAEYATMKPLPIVPGSTCAMDPNLKRQAVKRLIDDLETTNPHLRGNLLAALRNVRTTHLLDRQLLQDHAGRKVKTAMRGEPGPAASQPGREQRVEGTRVFWTEATRPESR